ncbi:unnamed protein product [Blepharisma stoltei]|uniref:CSC1/OSCA1-like cytosolic domain-containing protein n=1 Tax=Blepharisma stoltei TaxID=1481888 RepID=A0AAU9IR51_9CILI|nr:unnamed protein product [Blepharisma stoltei]
MKNESFLNCFLFHFDIIARIKINKTMQALNERPNASSESKEPIASLKNPSEEALTKTLNPSQGDNPRESKKSGFKLDYDPFQKADLEFAKRHRNARKVMKIEEAMDDPKCEKCMCCGLPVEAQPFSLCSSLHEFNELGPGFPLFYWVIKYSVLMLMFGFFLVGIACLISNVDADSGDQWGNNNDSWAIKASAGNQGSNKSIIPRWQSILHIVYMIVILISYYFLKADLARKEEDIDMSITSPSDYTILVSGLGKDFIEEELKIFIEEHGRDDNLSAKVVKINIPYDITHYIEATRKAEYCKHELFHLELYQKEHPNEVPAIKTCGCCKRKIDTAENLKKQLNAAQEEIDKFEEESKDLKNKLLIGKAFVTFDSQIEARLVVKRYGKSFVSQFWSHLVDSACGAICKEKFMFKFKNRNISAEMAPEPSDIIWQNMSFSFKNRLKNILATYFITLLALCASFGMIYGCTIYQRKVKDDASHQDLSTSDEWKIRLNAMWPAVGIVLINFILGRCVRYFTSYEKYHTFTSYNASVAIKLTIVQFLNTAIISLIANYDWESYWFTSEGLAVNITYIFFSNSFIGPLIYVFSPMVCIKGIKRSLARRDKMLTQGEANAIFDPPQVDMAQRHANIMKTILLTFCYVTIIPEAFLISSAGIVFEYWVNKYMLITRHCRPIRLSGHLTMLMVKFIPWAVLVYSILHYSYMRLLSPDDSEPAFIWMLIVIGIMFILPLDLIISRCNREDLKKFQQIHTDKYEDAAIEFVDDYDRNNPVTQVQGWKYILELMEKKGLIEGDNANYLKKQLAPSDYFLPGLKNVLNNINTDQTVEQIPQQPQADVNLLNFNFMNSAKYKKFAVGLSEIKNAVAKHQKPKKIHQSYAYSAPYQHHYTPSTNLVYPVLPAIYNQQVTDNYQLQNVQYQQSQPYQITPVIPQTVQYQQSGPIYENQYYAQPIQYQPNYAQPQYYNQNMSPSYYPQPYSQFSNPYAPFSGNQYYQ